MAALCSTVIFLQPKDIIYQFKTDVQSLTATAETQFLSFVQGDSGRQVKIAGGDSIGHCVQCSFDFHLWGRMKSTVYKRKVDTRDKSLTRILDAAAT